MEVQKDLTFETCFEGNDTPLENLYDSDPSNELKEILNLDQRITNNDSHNATQFQRAIESGCIDAALLVSAAENNFDLVKQLVQHGANVNGPRREKTCLRGFRQSEFQTTLLSYRD